MLKNSDRALLTNLLKNHHPATLDNATVEKIKNKFKELEAYEYLDNIKDIKVGYIVKYVTLNFSRVSKGGIVSYISKINNAIQFVRLKTTKNQGVYINFKPSKYHVFQMTPNQSSLRKYLEKNYKNILRKNKINNKN